MLLVYYCVKYNMLVKYDYSILYLIIVTLRWITNLLEYDIDLILIINIVWINYRLVYVS